MASARKRDSRRLDRGCRRRADVAVAVDRGRATIERRAAHEPAFEVTVPGAANIESLALSPDGRALAIVAQDTSGQSGLWLRRFDSPAVAFLDGSARRGVSVLVTRWHRRSRSSPTAR